MSHEKAKQVVEGEGSLLSSHTWPDWLSDMPDALPETGEQGGRGNAQMGAGLSVSSLDPHILNQVQETFCLWDAGRKLVLCNRAFRDVFGLCEDQCMPGMLFENVMAHARRPRYKILQNGLQNDGHSRRYELGFEDGSWLQYSETRTGEGGLVCVGSDISFLKQGNQELFDHEKRLTETVTDLQKSRFELEKQTQRLVELTEKYAAEKQNAEAANHAKSQFLANISHELRTPLNAVIGFSEIMCNEIYGPLGHAKYCEYAAGIHESGKYLLSVINDVLDMSRIEAGRLSLSAGLVNPPAIVADSIRITETLAKKKNIALKAVKPEKLAAWLDERAFKQILLNLLSSAIKFTPEGGEVCTQLQPRDDDLILAISDTGIGIPAHALEKLGRPFEQVENQFTKSHEGTGLGLAISRSLTEMHGGELLIESHVGVGTTVTCHFPGALSLPDQTQVLKDLARRARRDKKIKKSVA